MKLTALALFLLIIVSSCTMEKRLHNRGWNVQWNKKYERSSKVKTERENDQSETIRTPQTDHESSSVESEGTAETIIVHSTNGEEVSRSFDSKVDQHSTDVSKPAPQTLQSERMEDEDLTFSQEERSMLKESTDNRGLGQVLLVIGLIFAAVAAGAVLFILTSQSIPGAIIAVVFGLGAVVLIFVGTIIFSSSRAGGAEKSGTLITEAFKNDKGGVLKLKNDAENSENSRRRGRVFLTLAISLIVLCFLFPALSAASVIDGMVALALSILFLIFGFLFLVIGSSMIKKSKRSSTE